MAYGKTRASESLLGPGRHMAIHPVIESENTDAKQSATIHFLHMRPYNDRHGSK